MKYKTIQGADRPIRFFTDDDLFAQVESGVFDQARNTANTMGVEHVCVLPDCHSGYGAPIGSVVVSTDRVIPGPVGFDVGCGMALYLTSARAEELRDRLKRRAVIDAIDRGIAMGEGKQATHDVDLSEALVLAAINGGSYALAERGLIPKSWIERCERPVHAHQGLDMRQIPERAYRGFKQLGTLGGGNHFCELQEVKLPDDETLRAIATEWGLFDGQLVVMVHSGSRGFGHALGSWAFDEFKRYNDAQGEPYLDKELVHAPADSALGQQYLQYVAAGANFALCNRLLMARMVKRSLEEALPGIAVDLLYEISHNLAQWEPDADGRQVLVHRKGTTRALPAGHPFLERTRWAATGHPVITPGSMGTYSAIQVGLEGAAASFYSINHGAGRRLSRSAARKTLDQGLVDAELDAKDILINHRNAPIEEAPAAYKDLDEVLRSVQAFNLAAVVAKCYPIASMKGADEQKWGKPKPVAEAVRA